jgi:hypothetical protein
MFKFKNNFKKEKKKEKKYKRDHLSIISNLLFKYNFSIIE